MFGQRQRYLTILIPLLWFGLVAAPSMAQDAPDLRNEIIELQKQFNELKQRQDEILRRLDALSSTAGSRRAPQPFTEAVVSVDGAGVMGDADAKVTLVEFSDYGCPFCRRFMQETLPLLKKNYIDAGKVRYVYRDFPILSLHPTAGAAAVAARCAGEQGKYWEMHDRFFAQPKSLKHSKWLNHATALDLNADEFDQCLKSKERSDAVRRDMADGSNLGVTGTPTFFLGLTEPGTTKMKATQKLIGAQHYRIFRQAIETLLAEK